MDLMCQDIHFGIGEKKILKGISLKQKFDPPSNTTYEELAKKVANNPKAIEALKEFSKAIEDLEVQTPTEKRD